jgi:muramidase (phage lysozyme)
VCRISVADAASPKVCAFLDMLAVSEIGAPLLSLPSTDDGYNVLVGSTLQHPLLFADYADHPKVYSSKMNSDAAGRYQILGRYWPHYKALLGLPDFGPESQDRYAIQQIKESRALGMVTTGNIEMAIRMCSHIWASLPGSPYGQHINDMSALIGAYNKALSGYA